MTESICHREDHPNDQMACIDHEQIADTHEKYSEWISKWVTVKNYVMEQWQFQSFAEARDAVQHALFLNEKLFFMRHGMNHQFRCKTCHLVSLEAEFKGRRFEVKKHVKKKNGSLLFYTISLSGRIWYV